MTSAGLCKCGCGNPAPIAKITARRWGHIKGQPCHYIIGHQAKRGTPQERFAAKVVAAGSGCHEWTGARMRNGYGRFGVARGNIVFAHRFAYEMRHGPIPNGLFVLHRCDNPRCVNPDHLFVGSHADNMADMQNKGRGPIPWNSLKTHCPQGHEYTPENTYTSRGKRHCVACRRAGWKRARLSQTSPSA